MQVRFTEWEPSDDDVELLKKHPKRRRVTGNSTIGEHKKKLFNMTSQPVEIFSLNPMLDLSEFSINDILFCLQVFVV